MKYDIRHRTTFDYEQIVSVAHHVLHLMPRTGPRQERAAFELDIDPEPALISVSTDYFGNAVHYLTMQQPHDRLVVEARSRVAVLEPAPPDSAADASWETVASLLATGGIDALDAQQFAFDSPYVTTSRSVRRFAEQCFMPGSSILEAAQNLTTTIYRDFEYEGGVSDVSTPVEEVLAMRKGVCQDFAHLEIACLRSLGLAARYVSGYLLTRPPEGTERLVGADASHAWLALWLGEPGWIDLDPTNGVIPGTEHITVGWGRDYGDVSPINGFIIGGGEHDIAVAVDVAPARN